MMLLSGVVKNKMLEARLFEMRYDGVCVCVGRSRLCWAEMEADGAEFELQRLKFQESGVPS